MAIAEAQGWAGLPVDCVALATMGIVDVTQGRFEEAQRWLDRAGRAVRPATEPATALLLQLAQGMLLLAVGRLRQALVTLSDADRLQAMLVTPHVLTVQARWFLVQTQLKLGDTAAARATLAEMSDEERTWGEADIATASLRLAEEDPRAVVDSLAPVLSGAAPVLRDLSVVEALLLRRHRPRPLGRETSSRIRYRARSVSPSPGADLSIPRRARTRTARTAPPPPHGPRRVVIGDPRRARRLPRSDASGEPASWLRT